MTVTRCLGVSGLEGNVGGIRPSEAAGRGSGARERGEPRDRCVRDGQRGGGPAGDRGLGSQLGGGRNKRFMENPGGNAEPACPSWALSMFCATSQCGELWGAVT